MDRRWILNAICLACAFAGVSCNDDEKECDYSQRDYCSADATTINRCRSGKWMPTYCDTGTSCAYVEDKPTCVAFSPETSTCTPGAVKCHGDTIASKCVDSGSGLGTWRNEVCSPAAACKDGVCVADSTPKPDPADPSSIAKQKCTDDNKGVETTFADGSVSTKSCLELVGFEADCRVYSGGLVGCSMPEVCDDVFSETGTCHENELRRCDMRFLEPRPIVEDCAQFGKDTPHVCAVTSGKAACRATCSAPDPSSIVCKDAIASRCVVSTSGVNVVETGASLCIDERTQVSCNGDTVVTKTCGDGSACVDSLGICVTLCDEAHKDEAHCDSDGNLSICQAIGTIYGYAPVGKRECLDDILVSCAEADGVYAPKRTDCNRIEHTDGNTYFAHCQTEYQGMPDYDICVPAAEGEPCNGMTAEGACDGNTLSYCLVEDDVIQTKTCDTNSDGRTVCSVYADYADCRRPCTTSGAASCSFDKSTESYIVSLCAPSQSNAASLTLVDASAICLGDILYSCDANGKTTTTNCAANGGVCDATACVYPLCSANHPSQCTAADEILACQIDENGVIRGISKQSISCAPDGKCQTCQGGKVVESHNR